MGDDSAVHRIFFALRPDATTAQLLQETIAALRSAGTIRTKPLAPWRLHLTMQFLGDFARFPADLINHVSRAAKCIKHSSFGFVLDRLGAFPGHRPPYVLLCSARTVSALRKFRLELVEAIAAESVALQASRFIPHVTLAYGNRQLADPVPIDPIEWNVTEFVLIDSHVGMARHEILDRWPLRSPSART